MNVQLQSPPGGELYDPVTLYLVGQTVHADGTPRFRRPTKNDALKPKQLASREETWRSDVADYISAAYLSAKGGVLVLLTSHAERAQILERVAQTIPADCLLSQGDGRTLEALRHDFLVATAAGRRPCLLAVGAAWTGLDISGDGLAALTGKPLPANKDNVLTDLIIPIAPVGTNRTLTQESRRKRIGMTAEIGATSIMFRQGVGRLVRHPGVPANRRLHFLDARIHESCWNWVMTSVMRSLRQYRRRKTI